MIPLPCVFHLKDGTCFLIFLRFHADPFECPLLGTHAALPALHLYYESVRLPIRRTASSPSSGLSAASRRIELALPGSGINSSVARHGLRPRHVSIRSPCRVSLFRLQCYEPLGLRTTRVISGLNTFTCVVADFLLRSGFMQSVTVLNAEFRTELVVNLYSGWIVQLVNASLSWRTHNPSTQDLYTAPACTSPDISPLVYGGRQAPGLPRSCPA